MKRILLPFLSMIVLGTAGFAGGNIVPLPIPVEEKDEDDLYVGIAYTHLSNDVDHHERTTKSEMDFSAVSLFAGYKFNPYIAVEGRYGMTFGDPSDERYVVDADIRVMGIYAKPMYNLAPEFKVYGLLGYAVTNADDKEHLLQIDNEGGVSWGLGFAWTISEDIDIFADYLLFYDDSTEIFDFVVDSFNIGVVYRF